MAAGSLAPGAVAVLAGLLIRQASLVGIFVILSRMLSETSYGQFQRTWIVGMAIANVASLGIPASMQYFIPQLRKVRERRAVFLRSVLLLQVGGWVAGVGMWVFADALSMGFAGDLTLAPYLRDYWIVIPFLAFCGATSDIFTSIERANIAGFLGAAYGLSLLVAVGAILFFTTQLEMVFRGQAAVAGLVVLGGTVLGLRHISDLPERAVQPGGSTQPDGKTPGKGSKRTTTSSRFLDKMPSVTEQMGFALPVVGTAFLATVSGLVAKLMVSNRYSAEEFARFANGAIQIPIGVILVAAVFGVLQPRLTRAVAEGHLEEAIRLIHSAVGGISLIVFPSALFLAAFSQETMVTLFGSRYEGSGVVFMLFAIAMLGSMYRPYSLVLAAGKPRLLLWLSFGGLVTYIGACWVGLQYLGMIGPAAGTVFQQIVVNVGFAYVGSRALGVPFQRVLPWRKMGVTLAASAAATTIAFAAHFLGLHPALRLLAGALIFTPIYLFLMLRLNLITDQHQDMARRFLGRLRKTTDHGVDL